MPVGSRFMIWDFDTGRSRVVLDLVRTIADPDDPRRSFALNPEHGRPKLGFSPDGTLACLQEFGTRYDGDLRREFMLLRLFDLASGTLVDEFHMPRQGPVALSAGVRFLAVAQASQIRLIHRGRPDAGTTLETPESAVGSVAVDAGGHWLASLAPREGVIRLWDVSRRGERRDLPRQSGLRGRGRAQRERPMAGVERRPGPATDLGPRGGTARPPRGQSGMVTRRSRGVNHSASRVPSPARTEPLAEWRSRHCSR